MVRLAGVFPMLATPYDDKGRVDEDDLRRLIDAVAASGAHGLSCLGLAAEVGRLAPDERSRIARVVLSRAGATPVIVGCSADTTELAARLAVEAAELDAAVVMVAPPRVADASRSQLLDHYGTVATAIAPVPLMVQDAPQFIGVALDAAFVDDLASAHPTVRYAKPEVVPAGERTALLAAGGRVAVFGGQAGLYHLDVLDAGGVGMIPGCEVAGAFAAIHDSHRSGDRAAAYARYQAILPLIAFEIQGLDHFLASTKALLVRAGIIRRETVRGAEPLGPVGLRLLLAHAEAAGWRPAPAVAP